MSIFRNISLVAVAAASLAAALPAEAVTLRFTLTGDYTADWDIVQSPSPDAVDPGFGFTVYDVQGNFPASQFGYVTDIDFYNTTFDGGLSIFEPPYASNPGAALLMLSGAQLFSGTEAQPTFLLGTFRLRDAFTGRGNYQLTISQAVPEPDSWAMMLLGFGAVGVALRSRRRIAGAVSKVTVAFS